MSTFLYVLGNVFFKQLTTMLKTFTLVVLGTDCCILVCRNSKLQKIYQ